MEREAKSDLLLKVVTISAILAVVAIWFIFPFVISYLGIDQDHRGVFGDQYGSLNTLFTGLAFALLICTTLMQSHELKMQRRELELTRKEVAASTDLQAANLSGSLILPIFEYTRKKEIGTQLGLLANRWRESSRQVLGEEADTFVQRFKENPTSDEIGTQHEKIKKHLVDKYAELRRRSRLPSWGSDPEFTYYSEWEEARRNISIVAQQIYQIKNAGLVPESQPEESNKILRISAFPDFVSTYKYCVYPLDHHIEKGRNSDAPNYPQGHVFINMYTENELIKSFY